MFIDKNEKSSILILAAVAALLYVTIDSMPKDRFIVTKTGANPMRGTLKLFLEWGITFGKPYDIADKSARKMAYADRGELEQEIIGRNAACADTDEQPEAAPAAGGMAYAPVREEAKAAPKTKVLLKSRQPEAPVRIK